VFPNSAHLPSGEHGIGMDPSAWPIAAAAEESFAHAQSQTLDSIAASVGPHQPASIFQSALGGLISSFHSSLRTRKQRWMNHSREGSAPGSGNGSGSGGAPTGGRGSGSGSSSANSSAPQSPASTGSESLESMWVGNEVGTAPATGNGAAGAAFA
jgi:uncharacterized membrane protein YgcG